MDVWITFWVSKQGNPLRENLRVTRASWRGIMSLVMQPLFLGDSFGMGITPCQNFAWSPKEVKKVTVVPALQGTCLHWSWQSSFSVIKAEEELVKAQKVFEEMNVDLQEELPSLWNRWALKVLPRAGWKEAKTLALVSLFSLAWTGCLLLFSGSSRGICPRIPSSQVQPRLSVLCVTILMKNSILLQKETVFLCFVWLIPLPHQLCPTSLGSGPATKILDVELAGRNICSWVGMSADWLKEDEMSEGFIQSLGLKRAKRCCLYHCVSPCKLMSTQWNSRLNTRGWMKGQVVLLWMPLWGLDSWVNKDEERILVWLPLDLFLAMWHGTRWGTSGYNCALVL